MSENSAHMSHCKADRKKDNFAQTVVAHVKQLGLALSHVVDFCCFKVADCEGVLSIID